MFTETIMITFDTARHAQAAADDLIVNDVPSTDVRLFAQKDGQSAEEACTAANEMHRPPSLWTWLILDREGGCADRDRLHMVYADTIRNGRAVLRVTGEGPLSHEQVMRILQAHKPTDIIFRAPFIYSENAASYMSDMA
ncbi:hypothetical protein [Brytella acorum]|uniref:Uncharacterized protein n=1 Tax=Brytella acorum TaxID=2959299 RepID=A0AA35V3G3_9PROT|nr:hypothetical protein [Brytella acorum]MDF3625919.1 hypothetical protein [Brytella acorum]CAI9121871.1 hypothetical protein LMG32879_002726 [Brytella acorum]